MRVPDDSELRRSSDQPTVSRRSIERSALAALAVFGAAIVGAGLLQAWRRRRAASRVPAATHGRRSAATPGAPVGRPRVHSGDPDPSIDIHQAAAGAGAAQTTPAIRWTIETTRRLLSWAGRLENALLLLALGIYLAVRLIRLADFPIWFFADEAIQTVLAADFVRDGFRDFHGHLFPTYFLNVYGYNENLTVYVQVIPYLLFGKSVFVTRATSVLVTAFGALAIGLILRRVFKLRMPWIGILLLSSAPAWFLHSRTAFETTHMASYYAWFLYCYLRYRTGSPRAVFPAAVFAAATFYTTGAGQIIIAGTGLLLALIDARFHWSQRRMLLRALPVVLLLAIPYLRFRVQMGAEHTNLLRLFDSYWLRDLPLMEKVRTALGYYAYGISPGYWFLRNTHDGARHVMDGYGNLMLWTLPFAVGGLGLALWRIRSPEYRVLLVPLLAVPLGGVVVDVGITRVLPFVLPATLFTALAIDALAARIAPRTSRALLALTVFTALAGVNLYLLGDSLVNGPFWNRDYGMDIPWGAPQVYGTIENWLEQESETFFYVSPTWANGVDTLKRFFLSDRAPVDIANTDRFTESRQALNDDIILVLTAREYEAALVNPKLSDVRVVKELRYPDGSPGFYFVRMRYSPQADAIFELERQERLKPIVETLEVDGSILTIQHPLFDSGGVQHLFDGDAYSLARGYDANPMLLVVSFDAPRALRGVEITTGSMDFALTVRLFAAAGGDPVVYTETYVNQPMDPMVSLDFGGVSEQVTRLEIEIHHLGEPGPAKIHLREIRFR
jgi:4-amino-4-deoxy-L-arabinose transferase-like glycosyltransferase